MGSKNNGGTITSNQRSPKILLFIPVIYGIMSFFSNSNSLVSCSFLVFFHDMRRNNEISTNNPFCNPFLRRISRSHGDRMTLHSDFGFSSIYTYRKKVEGQTSPFR